MAKHLSDMTDTGALGGAFWGMLFGLIFFVPYFGMAVGAAMGALTGHYSTYGVDKAFIAQARTRVTMGTSALFLFANETVQETVSDAAEANGLEFKRFYTNLSSEQKKKLLEDFGA